MALLEYPLTHPYPRGHLFTIITVIMILVLLPALLLANIVTNGYELAPSLSPDFKPNVTAVNWWELPVLWFWNPKIKCQPRDLGRGDTIRLTPSLFEYKVHSTWKTSDFRDPENETRVDYTGQSFKNCSAYQARFYYSFADSTQTVTLGIRCTGAINAWMETSATFSDDTTKDFVGQFWGYSTNSVYFLDQSPPGNYREAVLAVLDVISADSRTIMSQQDPQKPILSLVTPLVIESWEFGGSTVKYADGTVGSAAEIYINWVSNLVRAVVAAVELDLGVPGPGNIFVNRSAVRDAFTPDLRAQGGRPLTSLPSLHYGRVAEGYQNWAQMLRAGLLSDITLGNVTGLPDDSVMVTNYLCPAYQLKQTGSLLSGVFVGTATMFMSVWAVWAFGMAFIAKKIKEPCKS
ncbi:hypothetical protein FRC10_002641 [Ceratobasidium sp. 414]|nr:hypothetical protein FRC10_002641 [Ceratobasidium sp. 414]